MGFRVWGLGFGVQGLGFRVWGLGFRLEPRVNEIVSELPWLCVEICAEPSLALVTGDG